MPSWFRRLRGAFRRRKPWLRSLPLRLERLEDRQVPSSFITEFSTPTKATGLWDIAPGPDGALWFTEQGPAQIGRITTSGTLTEYPLSAPFTAPTAITAGSDGALWFTDTKEIGRITTRGAVIAFDISGVDRQIVDIVTGSDGALWFTEQNNPGDAIGRLTTSGSYTRYPVASVRDGLSGITVGPDGALWFAESNTDKIGRLDVSGSSSSITEYSIPTAKSVPLDITAGPDGALWFVESAANQIGRLTTSGVFTEYAIPTAKSSPTDIVTGPDGALWFTEGAGNNLGRLTISGTFQEYSIPTLKSQPAGLAVGPDGAIWFTESTANNVGRVVGMPPSVTGVPVNATEGQFFNGVAATFIDADPTATAGDFSATISWGDGNTSIGTITANGSGGFNVSGTNTYVEDGSYTASVTVADNLGNSSTATSTASVADASLSAMGLPITAMEGSVSNGAVATFTDGNPLATTGDFSATISWGDGQTSSGTITQNAGTFTVSGSNAYAEAGGYTVQVSIQDQGGSSTSTANTATITDASLSALGTSASAVEGRVFSGVIATFTDGNPLSTPGDFGATLAWGDGQTSTATIALMGGTYGVSASHAWAEAGAYTIQVSIQDAEGSTASTSAAATVSDAPLSASGQAFGAQEGSAYASVVATFTDANALATAAGFNATITWGDGQTSTGSISSSAGVFTISSSHAYAEAGSYAVKISIQDVQGSSTSTSTTATISDAPLTVSGHAFRVQEGSSYSGVVATFTDANALATTGDFSAAITWGDGQTSTGSISLNGGIFSIFASHAYADSGSYAVHVSVQDAHGGSATVGAAARIFDAPLSASARSFGVQEGSSYVGTLATFTDANPLATAADFSAAIAWGDGHTSVGSITQSGGVFSVAASHTYAEAGSYTVQISVNDLEGSTGSATAAASISDAALSATGSSFTAQEGTVFNGTVTTFMDANTLLSASDFTATVSWGDGQASVGSISFAGGRFIVAASHAYARAGSYTVHVSIQDREGSATSTSAIATITNASLNAVAQSFTAGEGSSRGGIVGTFSDGNLLATSSDFTATVIWGDGQTSSGIVTGSAGRFSVSASHLYAEAGACTIQLSVRDANGNTASASAAATVADASLSAVGRAFAAQEGSVFSGVVATFTDANPLATATDFTATIAWGDGQTSTGVVSASGGVFSVKAAHTFAHAGSYTAQVAIDDIGGSTATGIAAATISDAPLNASGQPISLQENSIFSGVVANFTDTNPLGTPGDFTATIAWGDGQSSAGSITASQESFAVSGTHSYSVVGSYVVTVIVVDNGGASAATQRAATIAPASIMASAEPVSSVAGSSFMGLVATFVPENPGGPASNYSAAISWGDGSTTSGIVTADPSRGFNVSSAHTYAKSGRQPLTVTIRGPGGAAVTVMGTAVVAPAGSLQVVAGMVNATNSIPYSGVVASFSDPVPGAQPSDYSAIISWGDGVTSAGTIVPDGHGGYEVTGTYQYANPGMYPVQVTIRDRSGASSVVTASAHVAQFNEIPPAAPPPLSTMVISSLLGQNSSASALATIASVSAARAVSPSSFPVLVNVDDAAPAASSKPAPPHVPPPRPGRKALRPPDSSAQATPTADPPRHAARVVDQHSLLLNNKLLVAQLDAMGMGMDTRQIRVQDVAIGVGLVASAGYVVWALRNSYFLTSLLAAAPLWRQFDPLAVLDRWEGKRPRWFAADDEEDESLESLVERNAKRRTAPSDHERKSP
jgi:streptogramin lyase